MSDDDHHDDDWRAGCGPDAFTPPPTPARPTLRIIATQPMDAVPNGALEATDELTQIKSETLVRLEQFRPASDTAHLSRPSRTLRRVAAAGALATVVTAAAVGYGTVISPDPSDRPAPRHPVEAVALADTEHAATTRNVAPAHAAIHGDSRSRQRRKIRRRAVSVPKRQPSSSPTRAPSTSQAPHTNTSSVRLNANDGCAQRRLGDQRCLVVRLRGLSCAAPR